MKHSAQVKTLLNVISINGYRSSYRSSLLDGSSLVVNGSHFPSTAYFASTFPQQKHKNILEK